MISNPISATNLCVNNTNNNAQSTANMAPSSQNGYNPNVPLIQLNQIKGLNIQTLPPYAMPVPALFPHQTANASFSNLYNNNINTK